MLQRRFPIATLCIRPLCVVAVCAAVAILVMQTAAEEASFQGEPRPDLHGDPLPDGAVARLGTVRYRIAGRGYRVGSATGRIEFLPDSRTLLDCSGGKLVWLDATTGHLVGSLDLESDRPALLLAVSQDRSTAAVRTTCRFPKQRTVRGTEHQIVLIDTSTGQERSRLAVGKSKSYEHPKPATCAAFSPDGSRLAVGDDAGVLRLWNVATGREEQAGTMPSADEVPRGRVLPPPETVRSIAFAADGKWVVAASRQEVVRWKWQDDAPPEPMGPAERVQTMELAPDGAMVATMAGRTIRLFDVATGRQIRELTAKPGAGAPRQLAFTSGGPHLVVPMSSLGRLDIWNVDHGELERTLPFESMGLPRWADKVAVSPDDCRLAATAVGDAPFAVWDLETGERMGAEPVGHLQSINRLAVSPDGTHVLTAGYDGLAILWHAESGRPVHVFRPRRDAALYQGLAFSPDGKWIATSARHEVVIRDRESGKPASTLTGHGGYRSPRLLRFTPDSGGLLSFGQDWVLRAFDVRTGETVLEHALKSAKVAEFTPDGGTLVLTTTLQNRDQVYLINVETGEEQTHYEVDRGVSSLAISPDGQRFATVHVDTVGGASRGSLQYRRLADGAVAFAFSLAGSGRDGSFPVAFSPDGSRIATASPAIEVYDLATARRIAQIEAAPRDVSALAFTPDGERLVTSHGDATAIIWEWRQYAD